MGLVYTRQREVKAKLVDLQSQMFRLKNEGFRLWSLDHFKFWDLIIWHEEFFIRNVISISFIPLLRIACINVGLNFQRKKYEVAFGRFSNYAFLILKVLTCAQWVLVYGWLWGFLFVYFKLYLINGIYDYYKPLVI